MKVLLITPVILLAGCSTPSFQHIFGTPMGDDPALAEPTETVTPAVAPAPPPPPPTAVTVEDFDTTSQSQRDAAVVTTVTSAETALGTTIASLGPPAEAGIWLKTPLVSAVTPGRIEYQGNAIMAELRPSGGQPGSGSQISLAAMRLLQAPLTSLPQLTVYQLAQ